MKALTVILTALLVLAHPAAPAVIVAVALLALALWTGWRTLLACAARAWRWLPLAAVLILASVLGAHLVAVLLLTAVTAICVALAVLTFAIAGVVVESGWGVQPCCRRAG
jgi:hypothetical protein